jgi:hypothetical protein
VVFIFGFATSSIGGWLRLPIGHRIGPVLGAILTLAAAQGTTVRRLLLLFFYSLGMELPVFVLGMGIWSTGSLHRSDGGCGYRPRPPSQSCPRRHEAFAHQRSIPVAAPSAVSSQPRPA